MQRYFGGWRCERRLLRLSRGCPSQLRFAPVGGIAMNDSALRCLVDGGNQGAYIDRFGIRAAGTLAQCANMTENAPVLQRTILSLTRTFGG
jgi:hypothetical protein